MSWNTRNAQRTGTGWGVSTAAVGPPMRIAHCLAGFDTQSLSFVSLLLGRVLMVSGTIHSLSLSSLSRCELENAELPVRRRFGRRKLFYMLVTSWWTDGLDRSDKGTDYREASRHQGHKAIRPSLSGNSGAASSSSEDPTITRQTINLRLGSIWGERHCWSVPSPDILRGILQLIPSVGHGPAIQFIQTLNGHLMQTPVSSPPPDK